MKALLLIRHAKSSWDIDVADFDRSLNPRGHKDAHEMANRLINKKIAIDKFISSPAKRAIITAAYFANAYNISEDQIVQIPTLYEPTMEAFLDAIIHLEDSINTSAIFSHNPTISSFANSLTNEQIDDMPTCAIFAIKVDIEHWKDFAKSKKEFWYFDYPKVH